MVYVLKIQNGFTSGKDNCTNNSFILSAYEETSFPLKFKTIVKVI